MPYSHPSLSLLFFPNLEVGMAAVLSTSDKNIRRYSPTSYWLPRLVERYFLCLLPMEKIGLFLDLRFSLCQYWGLNRASQKHKAGTLAWSAPSGRLFLF